MRPQLLVFFDTGITLRGFASLGSAGIKARNEPGPLSDYFGNYVITQKNRFNIRRLMPISRGCGPNPY